MAVDAMPNTYAHRLEACRKADTKKNALIDEVLAELDTLKAAHKELQDDFDNEKEVRKMWKSKHDLRESDLKSAKQAIDTAKRIADSNAFALVVLDGDGAVFLDELYKQGKDGGRLAASRLEKAVKLYLGKTYPEESTSSWNIIVMLFVHADGLCRSLVANGVLGNDAHDQFSAFGHGFGSANALFNVIDVGKGKERADNKIRESLRAYLYITECRHIFFGPCHDNGYIPVLEPLSMSASKSKLTLLETTPAESSFRALGMDIAVFDNIFRTTKLATHPFAAQRNGTADVNLEHQPREAAQHTGATHSVPSSSINGNAYRSSWVTVATNSQAGPSDTKTSPKLGQDQNFILLSVNNERLDPELPQVSQAMYQATYLRFEQKQRERQKEGMGKNFCNSYHIFDFCELKNCTHIHGERLTVQEQRVLKDKARGIACYDGSSCRDMYCYKGHQCKYGDACSEGSKCRMSLFHYINTIPSRKIYEDGHEEMVSLSRK